MSEQNETTEKQAEQFVKTLRLVTSAMNKQDAATFHGAGNAGMDVVAYETTKKIVALFE